MFGTHFYSPWVQDNGELFYKNLKLWYHCIHNTILIQIQFFRYASLNLKMLSELLSK